MKAPSLLALALAFSANGLPICAIAADPVEGTYTRQWKFFEDTFDQDRVKRNKVQGIDKLQIHGVSDQSFQFTVDVTGANYHGCRLAGVANRFKEGFEYVGDLETYCPAEPGDKCMLRFDFKVSSVRLSDDFSCKCYCGMRAAFDGAVFRAPSRKPANPVFKRDALKRAP